MCDKWHINVVAVTKLQEIYHSDMVWSCRQGVNFALTSHPSDFFRHFFFKPSNIYLFFIFHFSFRFFIFHFVFSFFILRNAYGLCFDRFKIWLWIITLLFILKYTESMTFISLLNEMRLLVIMAEYWTLDKWIMIHQSK